MTNRKKGVSLIAVLLFMLVATIAATATFKWLNSEGRSSGDRLALSEARQSAVAGIETARSWMTYHGNETGALIKQYFKDGKKPILLDSILAPMTHGQQTFSVMLVGADVSDATYKLKFASTGTARNGTTFSEEAIMKVTGLYRVAIPSTKSTLDFNYALFSSSINYQGANKLASAVINGNWSGNPPTTTGDFIVTGNASLSGSTLNIGGTTCVAGNLQANNGLKTNDMYVKGTVSGTALSVTTTGNVYLDGKFSAGDQNVNFGGNLMINDTIVTKLNASSFNVAGNFCVDDSGAVQINGTNRNFQVQGNVWIPGHTIPFLSGGSPLTAGNYSHLILGDDSGDQIFIAGAHPSSDYAALRESKKFVENSSYKKNCPSGFNPEGNFDGWCNNGDSRRECGGVYDQHFYFTANGGASGQACGSMSNYTVWRGSNGLSGHMVTYQKGWNNWSGGKPYYAYDAVTAKDDMYYIYYNEPGVTDVEFKEYDNSYWKYYKASFSDAGKVQTNGDEIYLPKEYFSSYFRSPTPVGAYFVGGQLYYDMYSVYNYYHYDGSKPTGSPYCYKGSEFQPKCAVAPWFKALGTVSGTLPSTRPFECGDAAKAHCDSIWTEKPGCGGSKYKVDDPLTTAYSAFEGKANNLACSKNLKMFGNNPDGSNSVVNSLNSCYSQTIANADSAAKLYNGFLVVKFSANTNAQPTVPLEGKFIIIYENNAGTLKLGPSNGTTMIYLRSGANDIRPGGCNGGQKYKYFIYSEADIGIVGNFSETGCQIQGTIYGNANNCVAVRAAQGNSGEFLKNDPDLINALAEASVICPAGASCGGSAATGASEGLVTSITYSGYDTDYISTGAQLKIEMESQYKNEETYTGAKNVEPSIVVLPRIVYLNADAIGKLSDYYTVLPLNGATANGSGTASCPAGAPPTSGPLSVGDSLNGGFYYCTYTENGMSSTFHIVVTGKMSETPSVKFDGEESIELNGNVANENKIKLVVAGVTAAGSTPFTINIGVSKSDMNGWHLTPSSAVTKISEANGTTIYSYTGTASTSEQVIDLFTLNTDALAQAASLSFMLQNPSNCTVSSPMYKSYSITGSSTVKRASIAEFCTTYPDDCTGDGASINAVKGHEDCETGSIWVSANGDACTATDNNNEWQCATGIAIQLEEKSYDHDLCQIYIPSSANNMVPMAQNDSTYVLYASLKKKMYNLHVSLAGAKSGSKVVVRSKANASEDFSEDGYCDDASGCDFGFYAGRVVQLEANIGGDDKFSYWTCLNGKCSSVNSTANPLQIIMTGNYDYEAKFNEIDPHCFYTEFSDVQAFCPNGEATECIDKCDGSTHCNSGAGTYGAIPDWLMVYANQNGNAFAAPNFMGGYVSYDGNTTSGNQTLLLSRVIAGNNGTMSARVMMDQYSVSKSSEVANNGFILRANSDASSYILMNVYGKDGYGTYARMCYVTGQNVTDVTKCVEKQVRTGSGSSPSVVSNMEPVNVTVNANGNKIDVSLNFHVSGAEAKAEFDLSEDWEFGDLNDLNHRYVGLMLSDKEFKVSDIGWRALDFPNEACFDYPSVSCSFAANNLGGKVPLGENAFPWVGFSSWFGNHDDCVAAVEYYYNGCDMSSSLFDSRSSELSAACSNIASDGLYMNDTTPNAGLKLSGGVYNFELAGMHGTVGPGSVGHVRNAFVSVTCEGVLSNSGCGEFYVGEKTECSKNEMIIASSYTGSTTQQSVTLDGVANLRGATLAFNIESLADGEYIEVVLEDELGAKSPARSVTKTTNNLNAYDFEGLSSFNIEKVKKVYLKGSASYTLKMVNSNCPNAVSINNCHASYSGTHWTIGSEITHVENAYKCRVKPNTTDFSGSDDFVECTSMSFQVSDPNFYDRFNTSSADTISYSFTVEVFDVEDPDIYGTPAATCEATSDVYKHVTADCEIDKDMVLQTGGVPKLTYSIENCPDYGCKYSVVLDGIEEKAHGSVAVIPQAGAVNQNWQPSVNMTDATKLPVGNYTYKVTAWNGDSTKVFADCSTDDIDFDVEEMRDIDGTCSISGSIVTVDITGANYGTASAVSLVAGDLLGNILNFSTVNVGETQSATIDLSTRTDLTPGQAYTFILNLPGKTVTCGSYTKPYEISLTCPANVTGQKADEALTVTPTVSGCGSACSWTLSGTGVTLSGTDYNGGALTPFTNEGQDGNRITYTIQLSRVGAAESKSCDFTVQYRENTNITATCAWDNGTGTYWPGQSNVKLNVSNIRNLPSDQNFTLTCGDRSTSSTCRVGGNCDNLQFTVPSTIGNYTCILQNNYGDVMCRPTMEIKSPLNCSVSSNAVGYGETFTFEGSTASGTNCWNCRWSDGSSSHSVGTSFSQNITFNYTTERTYTFQCDCSNMSGSPKCTQTVVSHLDPPTVTCPTTHYTADPGASITFTPASLTNCGIGCNYTLVKDGSSTPRASKTDNSYTSASAVTFTGDMAAGTVMYTFDVTNSAGHQSCDFYVDYKKPTVSCPTSTIDAEVGGSISFTPSVTNCTSCSYEVKNSGGTTLKTGSGYSGGAITFTGENVTGSKTYSFSVSNGASSANCSFNVNYKEPEVDCPTTTYEVEPGESIYFTPTVSNCSSNCTYSIKTTGGTQLQGASYTGGGITFATETTGEGNKTYNLIVGNGTSSDYCSINVKYKEPEVTCPTTPYSVEPGGSIGFSPASLTNCSRGCNYTIAEVGGGSTLKSGSISSTGSTISFNGAGNTNSNSYRFTVSNSANKSANCDFSVNYLKPTFSCPANQSVRENSSVSVALSNMTNCTNGCNYSVSGGSTNISGSISGNGNKTLDRSITGEDGGNTTTYTVTLTNGAGSESCTFDVEYSAVTVVADCYFEENNNRMNPAEGYAGRSYTFQIKVTGGITSNVSGNFTFNSSSEGMTLYYNPNSWDNNRWSKSITMPTTPGSYPYSVTYKDRPVCSGNFVVKSKLDCGVNKTEIALGESFTFTASYAGSCWNSSFSGNGSNGHGNCSSSFSVKPSSTGTQTYTYRVDNGSVGSAECSKQVVVVAPQIAISSCAGNQSNVAIGSTVNFKPTVSNCDGSCSWELYEDGSYRTSGSGYNGTSQLSFSGSNSTGTKNYTFKVSKDGVNKECNFSVTYVEPPSSSSEASSSSAATEVCHCDSYCASGCGSIVTASGTYNSSGTRCVFFTSASKLNVNANAVINGYTLTTNPQCYSTGACDSHLSGLGISKVDGGYYMYIPSWTYAEIGISGSDPCAGGGGSTSSSSAGGGGGGAITVTFTGGNTYDFEVGQSYVLSCSNSNNLICGANGGGKKIFVNGSEKWTSFDWQSLSNIQDTGVSCTSGKTITVTGGTLHCKHGW